MGLALVRMWFSVFLMLVPGFCADVLAVEVGFYLARGIAAGLVAALFFARGLSVTTTWDAASLPLGLAMGACGCIVAFAPLGIPLGFALSVVAIAGAGVSWCYLRCVYVLAQLDLKSMATCILASISLHALGRIALSMIPNTAVVMACISLLPAAAMLMCRLATTRLAGLAATRTNAIEPATVQEDQRYGWPLFACLAAYGFVTGALHLSGYAVSEEPQAISVLWPLGTVAACAALYWFVVLGERGIRVDQLCQATLFILVGGVFVLSSGVLGSSGPFVLESIQVVASVVIILLMADAARVGLAHPYVTYGACLCVYLVCRSLGMGVSGALGSDSLPVWLSAGLVYALMLGCLLVTNVQRHRRTGEVVQNTPRDVVAERCAELGACHGLTDREVEVMQYICRGHSKGSIAALMGISEHTVREHSKHLYAKLGVHSKQEIVELVYARN